MTLNTRVIGLFLSRQTIDFVPLSDGLQLQVLPSMAHLPRCQKHHFGAFIQDRQILVIWDDNPRHILDRAETIQQSLMKMIWKGENKFEDMEEKKTEDAVVMGIDAEGVSPGDLEAALQLETRPTLLINPIMVGITLLILVSALGIGWRNLAQEVTVDGSFLRLALVACTPAQIFVSLVSSFYFWTGCVLINLVLYANNCDRRTANNRANRSNEYELQILLGEGASPIKSQLGYPSSRYGSNASLQGRPCGGYTTYSNVVKVSHFHI
jgi:hypothetical protein